MKLPIHAVLAALILITICQPIQAELPGAEKVKSAEAIAAIRKHEDELEQLNATYRQHARELERKFSLAMEQYKSQLAESLDEARKEATINDKLDEAIVLRNAVELVNQMETDPPGKDATPATGLAFELKQLEHDLANDEQWDEKLGANRYPRVDEFQRWLKGSWKTNDNLVISIGSNRHYTRKNFTQPYLFHVRSDGFIYVLFLNYASKDRWMKLVPAQDRNSRDRLLEQDGKLILERQ